MAVRLRLKRMGRRNRPFYRIIAIDGRKKRGGEALEVLGHYDPLVREAEKQVAIKRDRVEHWLSVGAQPSETVGSIIKRAGIKLKK